MRGFENLASGLHLCALCSGLQNLEKAEEVGFEYKITWREAQGLAGRKDMKTDWKKMKYKI